MPRLARKVVVDLLRHFAQRANNRQDVSFIDDDRNVYLELLKQQSHKYALAVTSK